MNTKLNHKFVFNKKYDFFTDWGTSVGVNVSNTSNENNFSCEQCQRSYKKKITLVRHQRYECGKEPQFPCFVCPYRAKHKGHLNSHLKFKHGILSA